VTSGLDVSEPAPSQASPFSAGPAGMRSWLGAATPTSRWIHILRRGLQAALHGAGAARIRSRVQRRGQPRGSSAVSGRPRRRPRWPAPSGCVAGELDAGDERGVFGVRCVEPGETVSARTSRRSNNDIVRTARSPGVEDEVLLQPSIRDPIRHARRRSTPPGAESTRLVMCCGPRRGQQRRRCCCHSCGSGCRVTRRR
jgi:hypothetical protein